MKVRGHVSFAVAVLVLPVSAALAAPVRLLEPVRTYEPQPSLKTMVFQRQDVKVNLAGVGASVLEIPLFKETVIAKRKILEFLRDGGTWTGQIAHEPNSAVLLASEDDVLVGSIIRESGVQYRIGADENGQQFLEQIDNARALPEGIPGRLPSDYKRRALLETARDGCFAESFPMIDLLVLYSISARQRAGGPDGMRALIRLAALETNWSFFISGVKAAVRVVERRELGRVDSDQDDGVNGLETLRDRLRDPADGVFDIAQTLRNDYAADAVVLIVEKGDFAGMAYVMEEVDEAFETYAYCVVQRRFAIGNFSFAHEIGHLMGARHEWSADCTNGKPFDSNHGYVCLRPKRGRKPWRTLMATHDQCNRLNVECRRLLRWSDPNASLSSGDKLGVGEPMPTDNHAALNATASLIATFRCR